MSPRRRQQYRPRRRQVNDPGPQQQIAQAAVEAGARRLLATLDMAELHALVDRSREACQWADQQAQEQPTPQSLIRYRAAQRALAEAERALSLANHDQEPSG